jgi:putative spermidine/putrescine transport system permease protein
MGKIGRSILCAWFIAIAVFLLFPLGFLVPISLNASEILGFPPQNWSLRWYGALLFEPSWHNALLLSLKLAAVVTVLSVLVGVAAAVAIVRSTGAGGRLLYGLSVAPLVVPGIVLALGIFMVFARAKLIQNFFALAVAHAVVATPFVVVVVVAALRNLDETINRAARVSGAGPLQAFLLITVPALRPALLAGAMFAFFASFDDLLITMFVGGAMETLPMRIWNDLNLRLDPTVAAAACMMVAMSVVGLGLAEFARRAGDRLLRTGADHGNE